VILRCGKDSQQHLLHADVVVANMREDFAAVDAEELAENSSDDDRPSDSPTLPATVRCMKQNFAGFKATTTVAVAEDVSPQRFGGGQAVGHDC
jgi:hypothetical protein